MKWILALVLPLVKGDVLWQDVCTQADVKSSVWCDITKPHDVRAAAFVAALKTAEKIPIMVNEEFIVLLSSPFRPCCLNISFRATLLTLRKASACKQRV